MADIEADGEDDDGEDDDGEDDDDEADIEADGEDDVEADDETNGETDDGEADSEATFFVTDVVEADVGGAKVFNLATESKFRVGEIGLLLLLPLFV